MVRPFRYKILHNTVHWEYVYCLQLTQGTNESFKVICCDIEAGNLVR